VADASTTRSRLCGVTLRNYMITGSPSSSMTRHTRTCRDKPQPREKGARAPSAARPPEHRSHRHAVGRHRPRPAPMTGSAPDPGHRRCPSRPVRFNPRQETSSQVRGHLHFHVRTLERLLSGGPRLSRRLRRPRPGGGIPFLLPQLHVPFYHDCGRRVSLHCGVLISRARTTCPLGLLP
jgi:hypothetical protein